jgi:L-lactate dehydrogenase
MKAGIVGTGGVGAACALSIAARGVARDLVLVDRTRKRARAVAEDLSYGAPLSRAISLRDGDYGDLDDAALVIVTVGVNERTGGATDRTDPAGRLHLLETNAAIYREVMPRIVRAAPHATLLVVTDPPDPLADIAREIAGHDHVLSTGTYLDSLRFRVHLARELGVSPASVEAMILGEHGTSEVFAWSSARVAGASVLREMERRHLDRADFRKKVEHAVRFANISIIEGNGASQYGIAMVVARLTEAILRDERIVAPIGKYQSAYGVTLSLPAAIGRQQVEVLEPDLSGDERRGLELSAEALKNARRKIERVGA